jgi:hypothetical protein
MSLGPRDQHASALKGLRLSARLLRRLVSFLHLRPRPAAHEVPLIEAVRFDAHGVSPRRLAESETL